MPHKEIPNFCSLETVAKRFLFKQMEKLQLSVRAYSRILKLGRTIAGLEGSRNVELEHVAEAVSYRGLDRAIKLEDKKAFFE